MRRALGRRAAAALVLAGVVAATGACGYSLRGTLPSHIKTVAVPIFINRTQEPAVEGFITRAVVEAFATNGRLRVVGPDDADAILRGDIIMYDVSPIAFDQNAHAQIYRLTVTLNLTLRDVRRNALLWSQTGLTEKSDFRVQNAVAQTIAREQSVLQQAAVEIGRSIVSLAVERF